MLLHIQNRFKWQQYYTNRSLKNTQKKCRMNTNSCVRRACAMPTYLNLTSTIFSTLCQAIEQQYPISTDALPNLMARSFTNESPNIWYIRSCISCWSSSPPSLTNFTSCQSDTNGCVKQTKVRILYTCKESERHIVKFDLQCVAVDVKFKSKNASYVSIQRGSLQYYMVDHYYYSSQLVITQQYFHITNLWIQQMVYTCIYVK